MSDSGRQIGDCKHGIARIHCRECTTPTDPPREASDEQIGACTANNSLCECTDFVSDGQVWECCKTCRHHISHHRHASVSTVPTAEITQANVAYRDTELTEEDFRLWEQAKAEGRGKVKFKNPPSLPTAADAETRAKEYAKGGKCWTNWTLEGIMYGLEKAYLAGARSEAERMGAEVKRLQSEADEYRRLSQQNYKDCDRIAAEVAALRKRLLEISKTIGETLPLHVQHRGPIDALKWFAQDRDRLSEELRQALEAMQVMLDLEARRMYERDMSDDAKVRPCTCPGCDGLRAALASAGQEGK